MAPRRRPVHPPPDRPPPCGPARRHGAGRRPSRSTRDTPVENERRPPPPSPLTARASSPTMPVVGRCRVVGHPEDGHDLLAEADDRRLRDRATCTDGLQAVANRSCAERSSSPGEGARRLVRVQLGDHHHHRAADVPAEGVGVAGDPLRGAGPAGEDVAQEVGLVLALDRRDRQGLGDGQRRDRRRPLQAGARRRRSSPARRRRRRGVRGRASRPRCGRRRGWRPRRRRDASPPARPRR